MKIIQILPAPGWFAAFQGDGTVELDPLACFALGEDGSVVGICGKDFLVPADEVENFLCYIGPGQTAEDAS